MLNICQLFNWTPQLDKTSLAQPVTKQCFMLFSVCVKRAENTLQLKVDESFLVPHLYNVTVWRIFVYNEQIVSDEHITLRLICAGYECEEETRGRTLSLVLKYSRKQPMHTHTKKDVLCCFQSKYVKMPKSGCIYWSMKIMRYEVLFSGETHQNEESCCLKQAKWSANGVRRTILIKQKLDYFSDLIGRWFCFCKKSACTPKYNWEWAHPHNGLIIIEMKEVPVWVDYIPSQTRTCRRGNSNFGRSVHSDVHIICTRTFFKQQLFILFYSPRKQDNIS